MRQQGEASVEEILASIKQVIARDNRAGAMDERRRRESAGLKNLSLEMGSADQAERTQVAAAQELADQHDVLDLGEADYVEQAEDFTDLSREEPEMPDDTPLTTDPLRESIRENFAALAMLAKPGVQPQIVRSGETSLEGLVRELLRPMLSQWLDANLPGMVEKMVQAEISRIAGKRG